MSFGIDIANFCDTRADGFLGRAAFGGGSRESNEITTSHSYAVAA